MSTARKLLEKMQQNPRDWRIEQLETAAKPYGINIRKSGGSHVVFDHPKWVELLCIPAHRPIKPIYVKVNIPDNAVGRRIMRKNTILDYPFTIRHLTTEEGGGYLIEFPDLPGCMSDGETIEEAIANGHDAMMSWMHAAKEAKRSIPRPGELEKQSGKWVQRVPKSIHLRLVKRAEHEGVSLNTLVISMLAEALGGRRQFVRVR